MLKPPTKKYLYWGFFLCLGIAIILALVGDSTIGLFSGDRLLAGRVYATLYVLLGGGMLICITPLLLLHLTARLRHILQPDATAAFFVRMIQHPQTPTIMQKTAAVLMIFFGVMTLIATVLVASGGTA